MVVTASTPAREYAAVTFLKWFTQQENNIAFSLSSGYLPVKKSANQPEVLDQAMEQSGIDGLLHEIIDIGVQITSMYRLYTNNAFDHGYEARQVVDTSMAEAARNAAIGVRELEKQGMARQEAVELLTGDAAFRAWLDSFCAEMAQTLK